MGEYESGDHNSFSSGNSFYQNTDNKEIETSQRGATKNYEN